MTAEQLLREPAGPLGEPPRSLSNAALMASLRPPPDYGSSPPLRRSMEPHLIEGVSWFLERTPWQRALLSSGLGALVGVGIVVTLARLFVPELGAAGATATAASSQQSAPAASAALLAPRAGTPAAPVLAAPAAVTAPPAREVAQPADAARLDPAPEATTASSPEAAPEAKPVRGKAARKGKAPKKRGKKVKQRARKPASLPARWSELYARER